jgi:hypothetical protein
MRRFLLWCAVLLVAGASALVWLRQQDRAQPIVDDAKAAGKTARDFPETASHAFDAMDGGIILSDEQRRGRNTWLLWTAGDQVFWDRMARQAFGIVDLLKLVDSRQRASRFRDLGLINQPGFQQAQRADEFGIWLDSGGQEEGVDAGVYGRPSGIVGLRLYANPAFDAAARRHWNPARYFGDPSYYNDPQLVRPYVVGMACAFCHVAFNPLHPPADADNPRWEDLASTVGNQYLNAGGIFANQAEANSYAYQLLHSWARGTVDTSFIATDNLDNPSKINPIYGLGARMTVAHEEMIGGGALDFPGVHSPSAVPHILKDGADSVGVQGALARVYVSIGEFSQQWLSDHNAFIGGTPQRPFSVQNAQRNSVYWQATTDRLSNLAKFLTAMQGPHLRDASGGEAYLSHDARQLERGKRVFAENCAGCHSSKQPPSGMTRSESQAWMVREVSKPDFLLNNFLSNENRISVSQVGTNAARAVGTNAMRGHVWDNFSSETYKSLPSAGVIEVQDPESGAKSQFQMPDGGRGYYRVPSLIGIWASSPLLHNSSIGKYTGDPSVQARVKAFEEAMRLLLSPEKRSGLSSIARTGADSYIEVPVAHLPSALRPLARDGLLRIGPIPAGTPVDLVANIDLNVANEDHAVASVRLAGKAQGDFIRISAEHMDADHARQLMKNLLPDLIQVSKCPDFVRDRGHIFGSTLPDGDKQALIEFVKTF